MLRGLFGNLIFSIIARMLCGDHLKCLLFDLYLPLILLLSLKSFGRVCQLDELVVTRLVVYKNVSCLKIDEKFFSYS